LVKYVWVGVKFKRVWVISHLFLFKTIFIKKYNMATTINATPTTDINFDKNLTYENDFAKWLTDMVSYWSKNYTGCTFEITKVGTEPNGLSANIKTTPKTGVNVDCNSSLTKDLNTVQQNNKITVQKEASETKTIFTVTWKKDKSQENKDDKEEKSEKKDKKTKNDNTDDVNSEDSKGAMYDRVFGKLGQNVIQSALKGVQNVAGTVKNAVQTVTGESHYVNDKRLVEEIERIKELLK